MIDDLNLQRRNKYASLIHCDLHHHPPGNDCDIPYWKRKIISSAWISRRPSCDTGGSREAAIVCVDATWCRHGLGPWGETVKRDGKSLNFFYFFSVGSALVFFAVFVWDLHSTRISLISIWALINFIYTVFTPSLMHLFVGVTSRLVSSLSVQALPHPPPRYPATPRGDQRPPVKPNMHKPTAQPPPPPPPLGGVGPTGPPNESPREDPGEGQGSWVLTLLVLSPWIFYDVLTRTTVKAAVGPGPPNLT